MSKGRSPPEMNVLEAQRIKLGHGTKDNQSAQSTPFSHDYFYVSTSEDSWWLRYDYHAGEFPPVRYLSFSASSSCHC